MSYWCAAIPSLLWIFWFLWHVPKAAHKIHQSLEEKHIALLNRLKPKFKFSFNDNLAGCCIATAPEWTYFRLCIEPDCEMRIEDCTGFLVKIEKGNRVVYDCEPRRLPFAPAESDDCFSKTLHPKTAFFIDVLICRDKTSNYYTQGKEPLISIASKPIFDSLDGKGGYIFKEHGDYFITINVSGKDVSTQTVRLQFSWAGNVEESSIKIA